MEVNKTYQGDCLDLMLNIQSKSVDLLFADLPYGTTKAKWDKQIDLPEFWNQARRVLKPNGVIVCSAQIPFSIILGYSNLKMLKHEWIWEKTQATGHQNAKKNANESAREFIDFL